jgi:hypothetical protein
MSLSSEDEMDNALRLCQQVAQVSQVVHVIMDMYDDYDDDSDDSWNRTRREARYIRPRNNTDFLVTARHYLHEQEFNTVFRMKPESFTLLVSWIKPYLVVNELQSKRSSSGIPPLTTEMMLLCLLWYLAGGNPQQIRDRAQCSRATFYVVVWRVMDAIHRLPQMKITRPRNIEGLNELRRGFTSISTKGIMDGCVGAIDGYLCTINPPPPESVQNKVTEYWSGHYKEYGLNCQAMCDSFCCFTSFNIMAPGRSHDWPAYAATELKNWVDNLPPTYFVVADNAYKGTDKLVVPFQGQQRGNIDNSNFNFFLSQLRINIERSFGLLVGKWSILQKPLKVKFERIAKLVLACAKLHNFCIRQRVDDGAAGASLPVPIQLRKGVPPQYGNRGYLPVHSDNLRARHNATAVDFRATLVA